MQIGALALWAWCACRHSLPAGLRHWQLRWLIPATLGLLGFQVFFFWGALHREHGGPTDAKSP